MVAEPRVLSLAPLLSKSVTSEESLNLSISAWVTMEKNSRANFSGHGEDDMSDCTESS